MLANSLVITFFVNVYHQKLVIVIHISLFIEIILSLFIVYIYIYIHTVVVALFAALIMNFKNNHLLIIIGVIHEVDSYFMQHSTSCDSIGFNTTR